MTHYQALELKTGTRNHNDLQKACVRYLNYQGNKWEGRVFSINQNASNPIQAGKWKALGFNKGIWDLLLIGQYGFVFIEFKTGKANLTKEQKAFKNKILSTDTKAQFFIIRNIEELIAIERTM